MKSSDKIDQLQAALMEYQATHKHVGMDGLNPHYNSKFATLGKCRDAADLENYGLAYIQGGLEGAMGVTTRLIHSSGQWIETVMFMPHKDNDPQKAASAVTYARRYALLAILGLVGDEDDDGNNASTPPQQQASQRQAPQQQQSAPQQQSKSAHRYAWTDKQQYSIKKWFKETLDLKNAAEVQAWLDARGFGEEYGQRNTVFDMNKKTATAIMGIVMGNEPDPLEQEQLPDNVQSVGDIVDELPTGDDDVPF